jgi:hypothetical protein
MELLMPESCQRPAAKSSYSGETFKYNKVIISQTSLAIKILQADEKIQISQIGAERINKRYEVIIS